MHVIPAGLTVRMNPTQPGFKRPIVDENKDTTALLATTNTII